MNGVHTRSGGSHVDALRKKLTRQRPSPEHRLVAAVHVTMPYPRNDAPVKDTLNRPEVAPLVRLAVGAGRFGAGSE